MHHPQLLAPLTSLGSFVVLDISKPSAQAEPHAWTQNSPQLNQLVCKKVCHACAFCWLAYCVIRVKDTYTMAVGVVALG